MIVLGDGANPGILHAIELQPFACQARDNEPETEFWSLREIHTKAIFRN